MRLPIPSLIRQRLYPAIILPRTCIPTVTWPATTPQPVDAAPKPADTINPTEPQTVEKPIKITAPIKFGSSDSVSGLSYVSDYSDANDKYALSSDDKYLSYQSMVYSLKSAQIPSDLVSTSWRRSGVVSIRIYLSCDNYIVEKCTDGDGWYTGMLRVPGNTAAVTSWMDGDKIFIRVYVIDVGILKEYCWDDNGSWYPGALVDLVPPSMITAESWKDDRGVHIRVYGMINSEKGLEYFYDTERGSWLARQF